MKEKITLPLTAKTNPQQSIVLLTFTVVRVSSTYNAILERLRLNALRAVVSIYHLLVRFLTKNGIKKIRGDQQLARRCFMISTKNNQSEDFLCIDKLDQRENEERDEPAKQLVSIPLKEEDPEKTVQIGSQLSDLKRQQLMNLLRANADIFAWSATNIPEIPPEVITHQLNIDPKVRLVR